MRNARPVNPAPSFCLQEAGRIFCPRCGNAALDRVRVVVRVDGAEQYGVKNKHILRGTKFSLPKPKVRCLGRPRDALGTHCGHAHPQLGLPASLPARLEEPAGWPGRLSQSPMAMRSCLPASTHTCPPQPCAGTPAPPAECAQGGRRSNPVLREDELLAKAHLLRARARAEAKLAAGVDAFAPEYTDETWHETFHQASALPGGLKGAAVLLAGWRHNPNERKHVATNRRRK